MASSRAVAGVLALLHEFYPSRDMSDRTLDAWVVVFRGWTDDELHACALAAAREPGRAFFPTPGEIAAHRAAPAVDAEAILARISKLGSHHPNAGWLYPRVDAVRAALGDAVAQAYGAAGGSLCFADDARDGNTTTRDIARQRFAAELRQSVKRDPMGALQAPAAQTRLQSGGFMLGLIGEPE